jgi:hypothetical protein
MYRLIVWKYDCLDAVIPKIEYSVDYSLRHSVALFLHALAPAVQDHRTRRETKMETNRLTNLGAFYQQQWETFEGPHPELESPATQAEQWDSFVHCPSGPDAALWGTEDEEQIVEEHSVKIAV